MRSTLNDLIAYIKAEGLEIEPLTTQAARQLEPALTPRIARAALIDGDHQLDPRLFARALYDAVLSRGAQHLRDKVAFLAYEAADLGPSVRLESGQLLEIGASDKVVLAAGLGATQITGWYEGEHPLQLRPVYGDVVRVRVPGTLQQLTTRVIRGFVEDRPIYVISRENGTITITIGATGRENGEQIAANKVKGARCALAWSEETAKLAREHNNAQLIGIGGRMHTEEEALAIVDAFVSQPWSDEERHQRRIDILAEYERTGVAPQP